MNKRVALFIVLGIAGGGAFDHYWSTKFNDLAEARKTERTVRVDTICNKPVFQEKLEGRSIYHVSGCKSGSEYWIIQVEPKTGGQE